MRTCAIEQKELAKAERWLSKQRALWESRFDRFEAYIDDLQANGSKR